MKNLMMIVVAAFILMLAAPAMAQEVGDGRPGGFGIGLGQGTLVSGISLKQHQGPTALQGVVGCMSYGYAGGDCWGIGVSGDFLINMPVLADADVVRVAWNLGGGGAVGVGWGRHWHPQERRYYSSGTAHLAGQFVAGLEFIFPDLPLDLVLEWRPTLRILPFTGLNFFGGGAHIRFYLN